jgi:hypothetical protein
LPDGKVEDEVALVGMKFPDNMKMFYDPNIWSGGMAPRKSRMILELKQIKTDSFTISNGESENTDVYGSITRTVCDMHGNNIGRVKLIHVPYSPRMKVNMCSLSRLI